tara:strand:- start:2094 stop:2420 length:327 start_codon:yes stop_codon:yes gene_type:complete
MPRSNRQNDVTQAYQQKNTTDIARLQQQIDELPDGNSNGGGNGNDANYVHDQGLPSNVWVVPHNQDKFPSVTVVDTADSKVTGSVYFNSTNLLTITFNASFSGKAFIN